MIMEACRRMFFPTAKERKVLDNYVKNIKIDESEYTWEIIFK